MKTTVSILLVEDDLINRIALYRFFSKKGYVVHPAKDGKEALEIYSKNEFDLIIMDLVMPELDGAETARKMRFISNNTNGNYPPIIIITAVDHRAQNLEKIFRAGVDRVVQKPIEHAQLLECIDEILLLKQTNEKTTSRS
ncbi:response regulator [Solidesulfovibrio magneticus]|uniref:Response regulator receiver protein n=1 Tax=Solidesulfovibrio magneticus (strain ATCC 700980 / DSM 13731 / RS-1) TaxID=573370 RepID=C4XL00_SOLM1|nr:response regulator [Solidesulfovibrio magneticus]BAH74539.1 response regulator receiver protein [Solidesulfovibrio magneticus RS-1]